MALNPKDFVWEFVMEILRTGLGLMHVAGDLIEALPEDAYPGESVSEVVIDMMVGTITPVAWAAGEPTVREFIQLLAASRERIIAHLEEAAELARERES